MIVAIFIFSLIMVAVIGTFVSVVDLRKKAKRIQQNTENAHFVMEQMAKTLRTSSILETPTETNIKSFDYSQNQCIEYLFEENNIKTKLGLLNGTETDPPNCNFESGSYTNMTSSAIGGASFIASKSSSSAMGRVTIALKVCYDGANCTGVDKVNIQTTVSLRDYASNN